MPAPEPVRRVLARASLAVVGFWWLATGLIVALQRTGVEWLMALGCAAAAGAGAWLAWRARSHATAAAARRAFIGAALLWAAHQAAFYAGWLVGPRPASTAASGGLALALEAVWATAYSDAAALALLALAWAWSRRTAHPTALHALLLLWATHQLARLCLFAGVANPATGFLPDHLRYLARYFGPAENSPLLAVAIAGAALGSAWLLHRVAGARDEAARERLAMLGVLAVLATLEYLLLAARATVPLWEPFLRARGG